jgi:hypothetical protein
MLRIHNFAARPCVPRFCVPGHAKTRPLPDWKKVNVDTLLSGYELQIQKIC